jgi:hypothetical protein
MLCEICEAEDAVYTVVPTGEGMPQTLGVNCFARAGLNLAKDVLDPLEIAETLGPMFVPPARVRAIKKAAAEQPQPEPQPTPEPPKTDEGTGDETDDDEATGTE